jgi:hypothetical protein
MHGNPKIVNALPSEVYTFTIFPLKGKEAQKNAKPLIGRPGSIPKNSLARGILWGD